MVVWKLRTRASNKRSAEGLSGMLGPVAVVRKLCVREAVSQGGLVSLQKHRATSQHAEAGARRHTSGGFRLFARGAHEAAPLHQREGGRTTTQW